MARGGNRFFQFCRRKKNHASNMVVSMRPLRAWSVESLKSYEDGFVVESDY